jgi:hypothetical protein
VPEGYRWVRREGVVDNGTSINDGTIRALVN